MLRYVTSTLTAFALAGVVSVIAQEPTQPSQPPPEKQAPAAETLTGCVVEAKTTDGGKAFVLNKAQGGSAQLYVLAGTTTDVSTHVNKKVEVTGPVQQPSAPPAEDGANANPKVLRPPIVQVESVKVVADTCD